MIGFRAWIASVHRACENTQWLATLPPSWYLSPLVKKKKKKKWICSSSYSSSSRVDRTRVCTILANGRCPRALLRKLAIEQGRALCVYLPTRRIGNLWAQPVLATFLLFNAHGNLHDAEEIVAILRFQQERNRSASYELSGMRFLYVTLREMVKKPQPTERSVNVPKQLSNAIAVIPPWTWPGGPSTFCSIEWEKDLLDHRRGEKTHHCKVNKTLDGIFPCVVEQLCFHVSDREMISKTTVTM